MPQKEKIFKFKIQDTKYKIQNARYKIQNTRYNMQDTRYKIQYARNKIQYARYKMHNDKKERIDFEEETNCKNYDVVLCTVEVSGNKSKNTFIILSPGCNPCCAAGLPGCTAVTNIPLSLPPKHQTVKLRLNSRNINLIGSNKLLIAYVSYLINLKNYLIKFD